MNRKISLWLRRCQFPVMLLLSAAPPVLMMLSVHAPDILSVSWVFFAACALLSTLCLAVPGQRRLPAAGLSAAALLALGAALLPLREQPLLVLLPLAMAALLLACLPAAARRYESETPLFFYIAGVAIQVVAQFLVHHLSSSGGSPYELIAPVLTAVCIAYMFLLLLSMNRISLDNASLARHHVPAFTRRFNTALTIVFMALSLLLAAMPAVVRGVTALWHALVDAFIRFNAFLLGLLPSVPDMGGGAPGGMAGFPGLEQAETQPGAFAVIMEKIVSVITLVIFAIGCAMLLHLIAQQLRRLLRYLVKRLRLYMAVASSEYDDEITDTREDSAQREISPLRRGKRRSGEQARTPTGRIRQTYARLRRRHPQWADSSTARENLPGEAAVLYERARYSDHAVSPEDAERFLSDTRRL